MRAMIHNRWVRRGLRAAAGLVVTGVLAGVAVVVTALVLPLPDRLDERGSTVVMYGDGTPAHVFLAPDDRWRIPVDADEVDPAYVDALLRLEDKRFHSHLGVDPVAVGRAAWLNVTRGRVVSGGSTITMQLVRVLEPRPRTLRSKVVEAFRAFQLELRLSKHEILSAYVDFVPMGRNLEGVEAASWAYFGHSSADLSAAEIATLLAVPQNPAVRYPTQANLERLKAGRDEIATFLLAEEAMHLGGDVKATPDALLAEVLATPVPDRIEPFPRGLAHLARWLVERDPDAVRIPTTIDRGLQRIAERTLQFEQARLAGDGIHSGAVILVDDATAEVVALVGNIDFWDADHGGQIPAFDVPRSPGSALKPFIYAMGIDGGHVLPEHLVRDIPAAYGTYAPRNYDGRFLGLVRLEDALSRSLNLPFVFLLKDIGVDPFLGQLRQAGVESLSDSPGHYGLSAAVGGIEITPLELAGLYTMLANDGMYRPLTLQPRPTVPDGVRILSPGSTWLTQRALSLKDRPDFPSRLRLAAAPRHIHWKTGTSFGHRDAWAAGSGPTHTAVVWLGNVDNSSSRELVGAEAAGPILFDLLDAVSDGRRHAEALPPADLTRVEVCAYSGHVATAACEHTRTVFARETSVPTKPCPFHVQIDVDTQTGQALTAACRAGRDHTRETFVVWPASVRRWLGDQHRQLPQPPTWAPGCAPGHHRGGPEILSPSAGQVNLLIAGIDVDDQELPLEAEAAWGGGQLSWFVDGRFLATVPAQERLWWTPEVGRHEVVVVDEAGRSARVPFEVRRRL